MVGVSKNEKFKIRVFFFPSGHMMLHRYLYKSVQDKIKSEGHTQKTWISFLGVNSENRKKNCAWHYFSCIKISFTWILTYAALFYLSSSNRLWWLPCGVAFITRYQSPGEWTKLSISPFAIMSCQTFFRVTVLMLQICWIDTGLIISEIWKQFYLPVKRNCCFDSFMSHGPWWYPKHGSSHALVLFVLVLCKHLS